ncbi:MAG TPA: hypothetical protein ACFCUY_00820 [Xenococcaceae cyanobacterium]
MGRILKFIRLITLAAVTLFITTNCLSNAAGTLSTPYIDPAKLTNLPFGTHSHWLQPWRAYLETVPATTFLDGTGINFGNPENPELVAQMLAKHGIRRSRVHIGWNQFNYDDEKFNPNTYWNIKSRANLLALKKYGIRPLILLNSHQGIPCPIKLFKRTLIANANAGDTKIQLNNVNGLKIGYSGISNLTDYWAAEALITDISGNTVTLSKPLPKSINAGESVPMATLKYRPFSVPGSEDYEKTLQGWKSYVDKVAKFATEVLGTTQSSDKGFDLEIWNELTFGSKFLYINKYYAEDIYDYEEKSIWRNLVAETADYVEANSTDFQGVKITNGFANTIPWPASSQQPARINAISKHPYRNRNNYPQDESRGKAVNALGKKENPENTFVPNYSTLFPEYWATAIKTETLIRDMGPITSKINGIDHGRYARGSNDPVPVWITEVNIFPKRIDPEITAEEALAVKAKTTARYFCFYLNKGATQVHLYVATEKGGDLGFNIVKQSFLDYTEQNSIYPADDTAYTSPALATLSRIVAKMSEGLDRNLTKTRPLEVVSISDTHNHDQFQGDGSKAYPNLYDRDVLAFLPFQVNAKRFVIPYYVMTRDIAKALKPEKFTLEIKGVKANGTSITAYDPIQDKTIQAQVKSSKSDSLWLELTATDYPYLLIIQET